jgi:hypothetical protein
MEHKKVELKFVFNYVNFLRRLKVFILQTDIYMRDGALESAVSKECGLAFKEIYRHASDKECVPLS